MLGHMCPLVLINEDNLFYLDKTYHSRLLATPLAYLRGVMKSVNPELAHSYRKIECDRIEKVFFLVA